MHAALNAAENLILCAATKLMFSANKRCRLDAAPVVVVDRRQRTMHYAATSIQRCNRIAHNIGDEKLMERR